MISNIDFTNIKEAENFSYATKLDFFKDNTSVEFKPGLNIIFAPNGTGKSTLLQIMAQFTACEQGGVSTITNSWLNDVSGFSKNKLDGLKVSHDGQPVMYCNPRNAVGLFGGMAAFDDDFMSEGIAEIQLKESTGYTTMSRLNKILAVLAGKQPLPEKIAQKNGTLNDYAKKLLEATIPLGSKTVLLDEPESGLAIQAQSKLWKLVQKAAIEKDIQIIIATHSPFALTCKANFIELSPGYVNIAKEEIKQLAQHIEILDEIKKLKDEIENKENKQKMKK